MSPHKNPCCPKCHGHSKQIEFLQRDPHISDDRVWHGSGRFKCRSCGEIFTTLNGGLKRVGASKTYWKYKKEKVTCPNCGKKTKNVKT